MFPILQLGPLALQLPGLFLIAGVWLGTLVIDRVADRQGVSAAKLNNVVFYSLLAGILGARLGYALRFLDVYLDDPAGLISLNPVTLSPSAGLVAGLLVALVIGQRQQMPAWRSVDALSPALAVFAIFQSLANLSSGDAFGAASNVPWAIDLWGAARHPSQVYEALAAGGIGLIVWKLSQKKHFPGFLFLTWVSLASVSRLALEAFRGDSVLILGALREAQLVSLVLLLAALSVLHLLAIRASAQGPLARAQF